jgi:hypothetical protein
MTSLRAQSYAVAIDTPMAAAALPRDDRSSITTEAGMGNPDTTTAVGAGAGNDSAPQSQQETGGNGGEQLTHGMADTHTDQQVGKPAGSPQSGSPGNAATAATAANRTAQDTRGNQAGSTGTGLGAAQTGGNQDEFDMPKE